MTSPKGGIGSPRSRLNSHGRNEKGGKRNIGIKRQPSQPEIALSKNQMFFDNIQNFLENPRFKIQSKDVYAENDRIYYNLVNPGNREQKVVSNAIGNVRKLKGVGSPRNSSENNEQQGRKFIKNAKMIKDSKAELIQKIKFIEKRMSNGGIFSENETEDIHNKNS